MTKKQARGAPAAETVAGLVKAHIAARCLHVVAELGVADALGDNPASAAVLAARTGLDADALGRVLRLLAAHGIFAETGGGYEHTPASRLLRSDDPQSLRSYARMHALPGMWNGFTELAHAVRTGKPATDWSALVAHLTEHEEEASVFNQAMVSKSLVVVPALMDAYDFSRFGVIADIGGGRGHLLRAILEHTPASGILFELPHVVADTMSGERREGEREGKREGEQEGERERERENVGGRLQLRSGDFFVDPLPAADAYLLMDVLHDWSDADALRILAAVRRAAPNHARVLVIETLVAEAPGAHFGKTLDIIMLAVTGGRERTRSEYSALLDAAGLSLERVVPTASEYSIVEACVG